MDLDRRQARRWITEETAVMRANSRSASVPNLGHEGALAADVMIPFPCTCSPWSTVTEAVLIMREEDCDMIPVVDHGEPVGIVTDRDIALAIPGTPDVSRLPVSRIMNRMVVTATAEASVDEVLEKMTVSFASMLMVVDDRGLLVGTISWTSLASRFPVEVMTAIY
jgi:CBS domain-containing protein